MGRSFKEDCVDDYRAGNSYHEMLKVTGWGSLQQKSMCKVQRGELLFVRLFMPHLESFSCSAWVSLMWTLCTKT